ncbi:MAG: 50S ribosomal protein L6 [Candidatus Delongbacteria bacterium]|nr:50S ribosomal protein L6 [Candidatus Delongbacteria bacterium]MDD4204538.1 50S ribosomal protein L6 [Candidatus Delongbacteria bacterium]MDY0017476.1 50S ribosomal protein L6 [Candidatus Delongbacteria bacterium]
MSRIGKKAIQIPKGVSLKIEGKNVAVKGSKGELSLILPEVISIDTSESEIKVERADDVKTSRALHGLYRALINNMVKGVSEGFTRTLILNGVGWRMEVKGKYLVMNLGYSHPIYFQIPDGTTIEATQPVSNVSEVRISGIDKEFVGFVASKIRSFRKPEPYKGKGFRYSDETIIRKAGKTAK